MRTAILLLAALLLASCASTTPAPSETPTRTNTPVPTRTHTPTRTPTNTPRPTNTLRPTDTPRPTATINVEIEAFKIISSAIAALDEQSLEIIDVRYETSSNGPEIILLIEAKYIAIPFSPAAVASIMGVVAALSTDDSNFIPGIYALNIIMRDSNLETKQVVAGEWQDIVDFGAGRITTEQILARFVVTQ